MRPPMRVVVMSLLFPCSGGGTLGAEVASSGGEATLFECQGCLLMRAGEAPPSGGWFMVYGGGLWHQI